MDNFLTELTIPRLEDPTFQSQFSQFCYAIKDNFNKLVSIQYARGERGTSIVSKKAPMCEMSGADTCITNLGAIFLKTIFNFAEYEDYPTKGMTLDDAMTLVNAKAPTLEGSNIPVIDRAEFADLELDIFVDTEGGLAYISTPYIFIDGRIKTLSNYLRNGNISWLEESTNLSDLQDGDWYRNFEDFSCSITTSAKYEYDELTDIDPTDYGNWDWSAFVSQIVPKLYFDDNIKEFCWKVNGQETGITAQGIKGEAGVSTAVHICKGTKSDNSPYIIIDEAEYISRDEGDPVREWHSSNSNSSNEADYNAYAAIKDKDLVLCYYQIQQDTRQVTKAFLGQAVVTSSADKKLYIGTIDNPADPRMDLFYEIGNQQLRDMLQAIGYLENNTPEMNNGSVYNGLRGLFIRDINTCYHMLYIDWRDDNTHTLRLSPVNEEQLKADTRRVDITETIEDHTPLFIIDYDVNLLDVQANNIVIIENASVGGNLSVQGNTGIQGALFVQGPTTLQGTTYVQGSSNFAGPMVVQNLTVQGVFNQNGIINTALHVEGESTGDVYDNVYKQEAANDNSRFIKACVSEINNIKTYVTAAKLRGDGSQGSRPSDDDFQQIPNNADWKSGATHIGYIGISFNLHLIIGYAGWGKLMTENSNYSRAWAGRPATPISSPGGTAANYNDWKNTNLYNAREYNIPCYAYKQIYLQGQWNVPSASQGVYIATGGDWKQDTFMEFNSNPDPIIYEGTQYTPKICFDVVLTSKGIAQAEEYDQSTTQGTQQSGDDPTYAQGAKQELYELGVVFYQGSVESGNTNIFNLNSSLSNKAVLENSALSCLYTTDSQDRINEFVPLMPYQICDNSTFPVCAQGAQGYAITNQAYLYDKLSPSSDNQNKYKQYIMQVAMPRMCAISAGILNMSSSASMYSTGPGASWTKCVIEYSNSYDESTASPQRYMSFFTKGKMKQVAGEAPRPEYVEGSIKVKKIFQFNGLDVLDNNVNVFYNRLINGDARELKIQRLIDDDQKAVGTTTDTYTTTGGGISIDSVFADEEMAGIKEISFIQ